MIKSRTFQIVILRLTKTKMIENNSSNRANKIKNIWWFVLFFLILSAFLFPLIILANRFSFEITMAHQVVLLLVVSIICQLLRRKPLSDLMGSIKFIWLKELSIGLFIGAILMILPYPLLSISRPKTWQNWNTARKFTSMTVSKSSSGNFSAGWRF